MEENAVMRDGQPDAATWAMQPAEQQGGMQAAAAPRSQGRPSEVHLCEQAQWEGRGRTAHQQALAMQGPRRRAAAGGGKLLAEHEGLAALLHISAHPSFTHSLPGTPERNSRPRELLQLTR